jgi:type II secretory pathway pseudopilin PulG
MKKVKILSFSFMNKGFTLIETLVLVLVFSTAMGAVTSFVYYIYRSSDYDFQQSQAIRNARQGVETMIKEIREAQPADDGSYTLEKADDQEFIFYSDIDKDANVERVRYFLDGSVFKKGVVEPTGLPPVYNLDTEQVSILSSYVCNEEGSIFTYYDGDWPGDEINNPLPTPTRLKETKLIHVYLKINVDPERPPTDFELESDVQIRNLKNNL